MALYQLSYYRIRGCGRRDSNSYVWDTGTYIRRVCQFRHARMHQRQMGHDPLEIRTPDTLIKSQVLYHLS